jgi:hypothetical protein
MSVEVGQRARGHPHALRGDIPADLPALMASRGTLSHPVARRAGDWVGPLTPRQPAPARLTRCWQIGREQGLHRRVPARAFRPTNHPHGPLARLAAADSDPAKTSRAVGRALLIVAGVSDGSPATDGGKPRHLPGGIQSTPELAIVPRGRPFAMGRWALAGFHDPTAGKLFGPGLGTWSSSGSAANAAGARPSIAHRKHPEHRKQLFRVVNRRSRREHCHESMMHDRRHKVVIGAGRNHGDPSRYFPRGPCGSSSCRSRPAR